MASVSYAPTPSLYNNQDWGQGAQGGAPIAPVAPAKPFNVGMLTPLAGLPSLDPRPPSHPDLGQYLRDMTPNPAPPPSDLQRLIDLINSQPGQGSGGGGGGGAAYPAFDSSPYDNAEAAGRTAAGDANSRIAQAYADLHAKLTSTASDAAGQYAANKGQITSNGAALQAALQALTQQGQAGLTAQGVNPAISSPYAAEMATRQGQAAVSTDNRSALSDRLAQVAAQGMSSRQSDASGAETAGHATTAASLSQLLGSIAQSRSTAQAQHDQAAAAAVAAASRAAAGNSGGMSDLDKALKIYDLKNKAAAGDTAAMKEQATLAESLKTTPKQDLEQQLVDLNDSDPQKAAAFWQVINGDGKNIKAATGSGAKGLNAALANAAVFQAHPDIVQMVKDYYDTNKRLSPAAAAQLGFGG